MDAPSQPVKAPSYDAPAPPGAAAPAAAAEIEAGAVAQAEKPTVGEEDPLHAYLVEHVRLERLVEELHGGLSLAGVRAPEELEGLGTQDVIEALSLVGASVSAIALKKLFMALEAHPPWGKKKSRRSEGGARPKKERREEGVFSDSWYFPKFSRADAEEKLRATNTSSLLLRDSSLGSGVWALSAFDAAQSKVVHFVIRKVQSGYTLEVSTPPSPHIPLFPFLFPSPSPSPLFPSHRYAW
jgi:SH2 domain